MATIATLYARFLGDSGHFDRTAKGVDSKLNRLRGEMTKTRSATAALAGAAGLGFLAKSIFEVGAAAEETQSKFDTVFGSSSGSVTSFLKDFNRVAGLSTQEGQNLIATTGMIAQGMGFAEAESAKFAIAVQQLAGDLGSFSDVPIEETTRAVTAALTGERESLKRLGIQLSEADVRQRAMVISGAENASEITKQDKALATLQLTAEGAGVAVGDLARTQDSSAAKARMMRSDLMNMRDTLATDLLPALTQVVGWTLGFSNAMSDVGAMTAVAWAQVEVFAAKAMGGLDGFEKTNLGKLLGFGEGAGLMDPLGLDLLSGLGMSIDEAEANLERVKVAADEVIAANFNGISSLRDLMDLIAELGTGGGGGGGGGPVATLKEQMDAFIPTLVTVETEVSEAANALRNLGRALFAGDGGELKLQFDRIEMSTEQLGPNLSAAKEELEASAPLVDSIANGLVNAALQGKNAWAAFGKFVLDMLKQLAAKMAVFGFLNAVTGGGFGMGGGFLKGFGKFAGLFADGGTIPQGSFGVVGENGPEFVSGPAQVTPSGGGDIHLTFVTQDGRTLVDSVTHTQGRDSDRGRVIRLPLAAMAI